MQAVWVSLKENVNCLSKPTAVIGCPENNCRKKGFDSRNQKLEKELVLPSLFRPNYPKTRFYELNIGDPSGKIIELIFQRASIDPSKPPWKIKRVLRVKNSIEVLERFKNYREKIMKKAYEQHNKRHPRSMADGNELLLFYGTTMACCSIKLKQAMSELCKDPNYRACRVIHSRFDVEFTRKNGIRLSTSSEEVSDSMVSFKLKNLKRAVIVCRVIAGRIANIIDGVYDECDSIRREGPHSNFQHLIVQNPFAILPCFLIVLS